MARNPRPSDTTDGVPWTTDDLVGRVHGALRIAAAAVDTATAPNVGSSAAPSRLAGLRPLVPAKVLGETSLLLRAAARAAHTTQDPELLCRVTELAVTVSPHLRGRALLAAVCARPDTALDEAFGHLHLRDIGMADDTVDALLTSVTESVSSFVGQRHPGLERTPTRALEQLWLRRLWTGREPSDPTEETRLLAASVLGRRLDPLGCTQVEMYSFTHLVMYSTDSGRRSVLLPRPVPELVADAETALAIALNTDDLDLATEALWTWPMLGVPWSPTALFAWRQIDCARARLGFVPGPDFQEQTYQGRSPVEQDTYRVTTSYHTGIVTGILAATMLASPRAVDIVATKRDQPESMRLTADLRRAAVGGDTEAMRGALQRALADDLLEHPAAAAAIEYLRRRIALTSALATRQRPQAVSPTAFAAAAALATHAGAAP